MNEKYNTETEMKLLMFMMKRYYNDVVRCLVVVHDVVCNEYILTNDTVKKR